MFSVSHISILSSVFGFDELDHPAHPPLLVLFDSVCDVVFHCHCVASLAGALFSPFQFCHRPSSPLHWRGEEGVKMSPSSNEKVWSKTVSLVSVLACWVSESFSADSEFDLLLFESHDKSCFRSSSHSEDWEECVGSSSPSVLPKTVLSETASACSSPSLWVSSSEGVLFSCASHSCVSQFQSVSHDSSPESSQSFSSELSAHSEESSPKSLRESPPPSETSVHTCDSELTSDWGVSNSSAYDWYWIKLKA